LTIYRNTRTFAIDQFSRIKLDYFKENPDEYKLLMEVFYATPKELKADIEEKIGSLIATRYKVLERLFDKVPLKEGVDRRQAFELIRITLKHLEDKILTEVTDKTNLDEKYIHYRRDELFSGYDPIWDRTVNTKEGYSVCLHMYLDFRRSTKQSTCLSGEKA
jgi:hypothetical protein